MQYRRSKTPDPPEPEPDLAPKEPQWDEDDELLDEDDLPTSVVEAYRNARLQELKAEASKARFGSIQPISKVDYTREVTEASAQGESAEESEYPGTGVVCFLYKDACVHSSST